MYVRIKSAAKRRRSQGSDPFRLKKQNTTYNRAGKSSRRWEMPSILFSPFKILIAPSRAKVFNWFSCQRHETGRCLERTGSSSSSNSHHFPVYFLYNQSIINTFPASCTAIIIVFCSSCSSQLSHSFFYRSPWTNVALSLITLIKSID